MNLPNTSCSPVWLVAVAIVLIRGGCVYGHAGHSHGPEPVAPRVADVPPRFYAQTDVVETVLTFPHKAPSPHAVLFVASKVDNSPISGAQVVVDILAGLKAKVKVSEGPTSGTYVLTGLGRPETTVSLSLEIANGDLMEILSMDNIVLTAKADSEIAPAAGVDTDRVNLFGLPRYVLFGVVAMNAIIASVVLISFLIWISRIASRRKHITQLPVDKSTSIAAETTISKPTLLLVAGTLLFAGTREARAHAGDDHSGAVMAAPTGSSSGLYFLAINAQFDGDIRTTQVVKRTLPKSFRSLGQVEIRPDQRAVVTPPVEGKLLSGSSDNRKIPVQGDLVTKGQILVVVEQIIPASEKVTLTTERAQVEAELNQAKQELALAKRERERTDQLAKVVAAKEVDQARATERIAQDKVSGLTNRLQTLTSALSSGGGANVRQVPVVSPITGTISESHAVLGEYVQNDKALFQIINVEEVFVGADVFESDLGLLHNAKTARITLEAYPNESFSGTLHSIGQEINRQTRSAHVLFAVSNPEQKLRGGMFANIEIESGTSRTALVIPKAAVTSYDGIRQVFTKIAPETFQAQTVKVSEFREDVAVITEGLKAGDRIAISGLYQIRKATTISAPTSVVTIGDGIK